MLKSSQTENAGSGDGVGGGGDDVGWQQRESRLLPPFLTRTFEMVDDQETNSIISWNSTGTSIIIWDHLKFTAEVLPRLCRTSNLSSFIYQLNNYGFKKITRERYEYENQWFQAGKKHWLKNIKRRIQQTNKHGHFVPDNDLTNATMKTKLDTMMTEQNDMDQEIQKLRGRLENMEDQLRSLQTNSRLQEMEDEEMEIGDFLKKFMHYIRQKKDEASCENSKRPRLDGPSSTERAVELEDHKVEIPQQKLSSYDDDSGSPVQDKEGKETRENAEDCQFWKNMLEDVAREQEDLTAHHSKAILELDEMMAMEREIMIEKSSDPDVEEDAHLELWT